MGRRIDDADCREAWHYLRLADRWREGFRSMKIPAIDSKRVALLAEGEALLKAHVRLGLTPANSPDHAAHRVHVNKHHERVRAYIRALRNESGDS